MSPELRWDVPHLKYIRSKLARVTLGEVKKLWIAWPPQNWKTWTALRYVLWRMLREPGLRVGLGTYNQTYANKISRWTLRLVERLGVRMGDSASVNSWSLANGSTYIARGVGVGLSGEPVDLMVIDDPFKNREQADSVKVQEKVWEWYMDDVTPRIQQGGGLVLIQTRWGPGDLIGRVLASEDARTWAGVRMPAVAETQEERDAVHARQGLPLGEPDPIGREPGEALCPQAFDLGSLNDKRMILGAGFETLYQQNDILRGGEFFRREWFGQPMTLAVPYARLVRYWDLASSRKDSACYTAGVLMAKSGDGESSRFWVVDVIRGRWTPAERNAVMLQTAIGDATRVGFERTYFESPVFDTGREATRAILARMAGHRVTPDAVSGSKAVRAEPLAQAARAGLVGLMAGNWNAAYLTELEGFPKLTYKDQVDSSSGAFNTLTGRGHVAMTVTKGDDGWRPVTITGW